MPLFKALLYDLIPGLIQVLHSIWSDQIQLKISIRGKIVWRRTQIGYQVYEL